MISVRKIEYALDEPQDKVFSRLKWAVDDFELFNILLSDGVNSSDTNTNKEWIGSLWEDQMRFKLIGSLGRIQIIAVGALTKVGRRTLVNINFRLGFITWFMILASISISVGFFFAYLKGAVLDIIPVIVPIALLFFGIILIRKRLDEVEERLDDLFQDLPN